MKFTLAWLKTHLETDASLETLCQQMTLQGLEVEEVHNRAAMLRDFTIAKVTSCRPHPNADKLRLCVVDNGKAEMQVVCGAPNAKEGMLGVFAPAGTYIPGADFTLKESKIRGALSQGMLCSEHELCLSDEHDGIISLASDAPIGESYAVWAGLDDAVIEIAITPNRGDCLAVRGIARDLAAAGLGSLKPMAKIEFTDCGASPLKWQIDLPQKSAHHCPYVTGRYFSNINNQIATPDWMKRRLEAIGVRSVSAIVDITNYITYDLGRPLHVFDADKLKGETITMRKARASEQFHALNETIYTLSPQMTVIADTSQAVSLAGIMGGMKTGCTRQSSNVFLESAFFDSINIAQTGRVLNIHSDARHRFEREVDSDFVAEGLDRATALILDICGGEVSEVSIAGEKPIFAREINLDGMRLKTFGGVGIGIGEAQKILEGLGCVCRLDGNCLNVQIPSFRPDLEYEVCLIEEILRIYGYDNIPALSLPRTGSVAPAILTTRQKRVNYIRRALCARGLFEAYSWSFCDKSKVQRFWADEASAETLTLQNPISSELNVMRPSVLPGLLQAVHENHARKIMDMAVFEIGPAFINPSPEGQLLVCAGLRSGNLSDKNWQNDAIAANIYDAKADIEMALNAVGMDAGRLKISNDAPPFYHPGRSGSYRMGREVIAYFGEIHPIVKTQFQLRQRVFMFEIFLDNLPDTKPKAKKSKTRSKLKINLQQPIMRDFAFILNEDIPADILVQAVKKAAQKYLTDVRLFDIYQDSTLGEDKKSLALNVTLQPQEKSFTDEDIEVIATNIIDAAKDIGAQLRQ